MKAKLIRILVAATAALAVVGCGADEEVELADVDDSSKTEINASSSETQGSGVLQGLEGSVEEGFE